MSTTPATTPGRSLLRPSLDWLLVFVPIAFALRFIPSLRNETWLFIAACLAVIPLAGWMGRATEHLAEEVGEGAGGLLNATFGNAAELIIALMALSKGLTDVVKASITGSIIGNILLVLGMSFIAGGMRFHQQSFNRTATRASATALTLAAIALIMPTVFHRVADRQTGGWTPAAEQQLSLAIAVVLFVTYLLTLWFSLKTHKQLFAGHARQGVAAAEDEETGETWSRAKSIGVLLAATALVAVMSEFLVGAIEEAAPAMGLTPIFVGVIVVAIIGNAAEHSSAIMMAMKDKMDLSLGIAIGSSQQIALFVAPLLVFASYAFGNPMNLEFSVPEVVAVVVAIGIVGQISGDGESNWLEGAQLLSVYIILGILFYFLPEIVVSSTASG